MHRYTPSPTHSPFQVPSANIPTEPFLGQLYFALLSTSRNIGRFRPESCVTIREHWMIYRGPNFFSPSYDLAPNPPPPSPLFCHQVVSLSQSSCVCWGPWGRGGGGERTQIIRLRDCLVLNNTLNTLWSLWNPKMWMLLDHVKKHGYKIFWHLCAPVPKCCSLKMCF